MPIPETSIVDATTDKPPPRRGWIPVSVRMFAVVVLLTGTGSVLWIGITTWRQHVAVREIERTGGQVGQTAIGPPWLREFLGEERMALIDPVEYVHIQPDKETSLRRFLGSHSGRHR